MKESINKILDFLYENLGMVIYVVLWLALIVYFWVRVSGTEAFGYSIMTFYFILPIASLLVSAFYGAGERRIKYYLPAACGILEVLGGFFTFQFANMISNGRWNTWNTPDLVMGLYSLVPAIVGLGIGTVIRQVRNKLSAKK